MPRTARVDYPGAVQHVTMRGIERRAIFADDVDRARFVLRLEAALRRGGVRCLAWAEMTNHVHLLLETGPEPLARSMARLGTGYAMDFNLRHDRVGHLFQNRYHSRLVADESHLLAAVRYVHLNPLCAGIVPDLDALDRYPWTGHRALMGFGPGGFLDVEAVLRRFGDDPRSARRRLRRWMEEGLNVIPADSRSPESSVPTHDPGEQPWEAGSSAGAGAGAGRLADDVPAEVRARGLRLEGWDLERVVRHVCRALGIRPEDLAAGRRLRDVSRARAAIGWIAARRLGLRLVAIAPRVGVTPAALCERLFLGGEVVASLGLDILPAEETQASGDSESPRNVPDSETRQVSESPRNVPDSDSRYQGVP